MKKRQSQGAGQEPSQLSLEALVKRLTPAGRRAFLDRCLADDFLAFLKKVFDTICPDRALRANWLVEAMVCAAEGIMDGKTRRLVVNVPPRHLKSVIFSVALPAYLLGRDPTMRIICVLRLSMPSIFER
jgi:hypothetical protein